MNQVWKFIAGRYLFAKHRINFITIISYISVTGITMGVAALIIVLGVFNGFGNLIKSFLINFEPHLKIEAVSENGVRNIEDLRKEISGVTGGYYFSPFAEGKVLVFNGRMNRVVNLKGINPEDGSRTWGLKNSVFSGGYINPAAETPEVLIGILLADRLFARPGDTLTIVSPSGIEGVAAGVAPPKYRKFVVAGLFNANSNDYDGDYIFGPIDDVSSLLGYSTGFQGYEMRFDDVSEANEYKAKLESILSKDDYAVSTWYDLHKELFSVMQIERWVAYALLTMIILVATFNILASLTMSITEKKRDIGILRAMGLSDKAVMRIFMYQGLLTGLFGIAAGFILAGVVYYLQTTYKLYPLDPMRFRIDAIPMELSMSDFITVGIAAIILSVFSAVYPALRAAKIDPLKAIRWE